MPVPQHAIVHRYAPSSPAAPLSASCRVHCPGPLALWRRSCTGRRRGCPVGPVTPLSGLVCLFVLPHALAGHLQEDMEQHPAPDRRGIAPADGVADAFDGFRSDLPCRGQGACHMPCCIPRVHVPCRHVALYANTFVQAPVRMWETGMGGPSDRGSRFGPKTSQAPCELTVSFAHRLRRMTSST